MAVVFFTDVQCRKCAHSLDTHLSGLTTRLGPPKVRCPKCGATGRTGRMEWSDFTPGGKAGYAALTLAGCVAFGFLGGVGVRGAVHFTQAGPWVERMQLGGPGFVGGVAIWVVAILVLQGARIVLSMRRTAEGAKAPAKQKSFFDLRFDLQLKLMGAVWVPTAVAWIIAFLRARLESRAPLRQPPPPPTLPPSTSPASRPRPAQPRGIPLRARPRIDRRRRHG